MRILLGLIPLILGSKIRFESKKKYESKSDGLSGKKMLTGWYHTSIFCLDIKYETKHIPALIDNFDFSSNATYTQRYLVNSAMVSNTEKSTIFLVHIIMTM